MSEEREPTKAIARREVAVGERGIALQTFTDLQRFCHAAVESGFFKSTGDLAAAVVKVQYGMELGLPPVAALRGVIVSESGGLELTAAAMAALIQRTGRYRYRVRKHTDEVCSIEFFDGSESLGVSTFSQADAKRAEVKMVSRQGSKLPWSKFPRNMLFARALSNGARWYCPEIFFGASYSEGELDGVVRVEGELIEEPEVAEQPQSHAPQASPTSRPGHAGPPPASSAPAGASDSEPPPHDDGDEGPPETEAYAETAWSHARNAAAVKAAESELGAKVESVNPPKPVNIYTHAKAHGFRDPAKVDELIAAQFGERKFRDLSLDEKKQAAKLVEVEGAKLKSQGAAIVRGARGGS